MKYWSKILYARTHSHTHSHIHTARDVNQWMHQSDFAISIWRVFFIMFAFYSIVHTTDIMFILWHPPLTLQMLTFQVGNYFVRLHLVRKNELTFRCTNSYVLAMNEYQQVYLTKSKWQWCDAMCYCECERVSLLQRLKFHESLTIHWMSFLTASERQFNTNALAVVFHCNSIGRPFSSYFFLFNYIIHLSDPKNSPNFVKTRICCVLNVKKKTDSLNGLFIKSWNLHDSMKMLLFCW